MSNNLFDLAILKAINKPKRSGTKNYLISYSYQDKNISRQIYKATVRAKSKRQLLKRLEFGNPEFLTKIIRIENIKVV